MRGSRRGRSWRWTAGKPVWSRHLGQEISPFESSGATAARRRCTGLAAAAVRSRARVVLAGRRTRRPGKQVWKADRGKGRASYSTPFVVDVDGRSEVIVNSSERVDAYDATDGIRCGTSAANQFPIPVGSRNGVLYLSRGYRSGPYMASVPAAAAMSRGRTSAWQVATGAPYVSSLVHYHGLLYMANDVGVLTVIDAKTGERVWQERTPACSRPRPSPPTEGVFVSETGETMCCPPIGPDHHREETTASGRSLRRPSPVDGSSSAPTGTCSRSESKRPIRPTGRDRPCGQASATARGWPPGRKFAEHVRVHRLGVRQHVAARFVDIAPDERRIVDDRAPSGCSPDWRASERRRGRPSSTTRNSTRTSATSRHLIL